MDNTDAPGRSAATRLSPSDDAAIDDSWWGLEAALPYLLPALPDLSDGPAAGR